MILDVNVQRFIASAERAHHYALTPVARADIEAMVSLYAMAVLDARYLPYANAEEVFTNEAIRDAFEAGDSLRRQQHKRARK